jgi:serine/threonine-protein kinase RsbW
MENDRQGPQMPSKATENVMADEESAATETVEQELDSTLDSVDQAEKTVLDAAQKMGFSEDEQHRIGIAVRECMVNAVVHGNCYNARKKVHLAVSRTPKELAITIADEGDGFDLNQLPDPLAEENILRQSGRGVLMIQAFMDRFEVRPRDPNGTEVRMSKLLEEQPQ